MHKGTRHTSETRRKMSVAVSKALTGRTLSEEHKQKIGARAKGRIWTEEMLLNQQKGYYRVRMSKIGGAENVSTVIDDYRAGKTIYRIAKDFGTTIYTITRILKDNGAL